MPRAGTTYLYHAFAGHPGAFVPYRKELRYFGQQFGQGAAWYKAFFKEAISGQVCLDCSPDYFLVPEVPRRIREHAPHARVILGVRDPASWALSLHQQLTNIGETTPSLDRFLSEMRYPSFGAETPFPVVSLRAGFVRTQLEAFREALGSRLLMFNFEAFGRDPLPVLLRIEEFLGVDPHFNTQNLPVGHINAGNRKKSGWFSYVMSRDRVIRLMGAVLPRVLLIRARLTIDRLNRTPSRVEASSEAPEFRLCAEALAADREYVRRLFAGHSTIDGTGAVLN